MPSPIVVFLVGIAATYAFLWALAYLNHDPREPPPIAGSVPFISPLFGLMTEKGNFYLRMRDKYGLPIYSLRIPGPTTYVVNSFHLVQQIDRHIQTVAFTPIELRGRTTMGATKETLDKMSGDQLLTDKGYFMSFPRNIAAGASPGPGLDALNINAVNTLAASLEKLAAQGTIVVELFDWVRHEVFAATMEATYGPHNPFRLPENKRAWFTFESGLMTLLVGVWPGILAKESLKARDRLIAELKKYFRDDRHLDGSLLVQLRLTHNIRFGLGLDETAYTEIGQILADPVVFEDCQREAFGLVQTSPDGVCTIDLAKVRTACPILTSTWQEVLRFHGTSISARVVQQDTFIGNKYLLKKDSMVIMPTRVVHTDESVWGPTAKQFDHKRFLKSNKGDGKRNPAAAFRGFGGGVQGSKFALSVASGLSQRKDHVMNTAFPIPKDKVDVEISPKNDMKWNIIFSENSKSINMAKEILEEGGQ